MTMYWKSSTQARLWVVWNGSLVSYTVVPAEAVYPTIANPTTKCGQTGQRESYASSTEAEYVAMGHAVKEALWIRKILEDLGQPVEGSLCIYADNQSSLLLADSDKTSSRTKHLDVQYHFIGKHIKDGSCRLEWVPTKQNAADVFTKPLGPALFESMPPMLGLPWNRKTYGPDESECETSNASSDVSSGSVG